MCRPGGGVAGAVRGGGAGMRARRPSRGPVARRPTPRRDARDHAYHGTSLSDSEKVLVKVVAQGCRSWHVGDSLKLGTNFVLPTYVVLRSPYAGHCTLRMTRMMIDVPSVHRASCRSPHPCSLASRVSPVLSTPRILIPQRHTENRSG